MAPLYTSGPARYMRSYDMSSRGSYRTVRGPMSRPSSKRMIADAFYLEGETRVIKPGQCRMGRSPQERMGLRGPRGSTTGASHGEP